MEIDLVGGLVRQRNHENEERRAQRAAVHRPSWTIASSPTLRSRVVRTLRTARVPAIGRATSTTVIASMMLTDDQSVDEK